MINVDPLEILRGRFRQWTVCNECDGSGKVGIEVDDGNSIHFSRRRWEAVPCQSCGGTGHLPPCKEVPDELK